MKQGQSRIHYIDALRGTTMFLVVVGHVLVFSLHLDNELLAKVRMPTFFFISGYIAYKAIELWDVEFYWQRLSNKALVQLVPTAFFFACYFVMLGQNPLTEFLAHGSGKFWFTVTLFQCFACYFTLSLLARYTRRWVMPVGMAVIGLGAFVYTTMTFDEYPKYVFVYTRSEFYYFLFFVVGVVCRKHNTRFMSMLDNGRVVAPVLIIFMALVIYGFGTCPYTPSYAVLKMLLSFSLSLTGVLVLFALFRSKSEFFDSDHWLARTLSFIGRHTLDIYLLHYFFLPETLWLRPYFVQHKMFVLEFGYATAVAAAVVALCLVVSAVIRLSGALAHVLLGVKKEH